MFTPKWQITATTIFCETIMDEATILVYKDGTLKCTGYDKFIASKESLSKSGKRTSIKLSCDGPTCIQMTEYFDKLMSEEEARLS
jgi:hypothetical protein